MKIAPTIPWLLTMIATASCSASGTGPIALDDEIVLTAIGPTVIDVLDNDRAPAGDQLSISSTRAGFGSTSVVNDHILYVPPPGLAGDVFAYTVRASSGETSSATVIVTIRMSAPTTTTDEPHVTTTSRPTTTTSTTPSTTTSTTTSTTPPTTTTSTTTTRTTPPTTSTTTTTTTSTSTTTTASTTSSTSTTSTTTSTSTTTTSTEPLRPARFDPPVIDFGEVTAGRRYERVVTVVAGDTAFEVGSADPLPNGGVGFNTDRRCGELPKGGSCEATVTFEPAELNPDFDVTLFPGAVPSLRVTADIAEPDVAPPVWIRPQHGAIVSFTQIPDGLPVALAPATDHRELIVEATVCFGEAGCSVDGSVVERTSATSIERITFDLPTVVRIREALAAGLDVRIRLAATGTTELGSSDPEEATVELLVVGFAEP